MTSEESQTIAPAAELIAGRYRVEAALGHGGAGEVHRVEDLTSGRRLALKRLLAQDGDLKRAQLTALFEAEYHTLAQLAHPRIVEVYDYAFDERGPYYTMELLDGSDLRERAPLPWQDACALLREVCSALALLHSRRLVHRDLTPRNVRCTSDGRAKLLDFGALAPMGPCPQIVGTPAYMAPELVNGQELDGRADLYSVGALAYFLLTGRHAFAARKVSQLRDLWRSRPSPPSSIVAEVPRDLDALVLSLLSIDPRSRPVAASEVIARLGAVASMEEDATVEDVAAYLTAPALVGRSEQQVAFRRRVLRGLRGTGSSLLIESDPGMGRSRLIATFALEAKLAGAVALPLRGAQHSGEDFAVARALCATLFETLPGVSAEVLRRQSEAVRALVGGWLERSAQPRATVDAALHDGLTAFVLDAARVHPLCILVDDLHLCDLPSAALIAGLGARAHEAALTLACSTERGSSGAPGRLVEQLSQSGGRVLLRPLDAAQTTELLRSVFGDAANLDATAAWVQRLSHGAPSASMQLAHHLVEQRIACFCEGRWSLPQRLDEAALPASFEQVIEARVGALSEHARTLAQMLAIVSPFGPLGLADYVALLAPEFGNKCVFEAVDELVRAQVLTATGQGYALRDRALLRIVERSAEPGRLRRLHHLLAAHYSGVSEAELVGTYHMYQAGDHDRAFERQHEIHGRLQNISGPSALIGRSAAGTGLIEQMYRMAKERKTPPSELHRWQKVLVQIASSQDPGLGHYGEELLARLLLESGWYEYRDHPELGELERLQRSFERAQALYDQTPVAERGLPPLEAIRELAVATGLLNGIYARTYYVEGIARLPSLVAPFLPLGPVVALLHELGSLVVDSMIHGKDVSKRRREIAEKISKPMDGLDELTRQGAFYVLSFYRGLEEAMASQPSALRIAAMLEEHPSYAVLGQQVRVVHHLSEGDLAAAERARERRELLAALQVEGDAHVTRSLINELQLSVRAADLLAVKRLLERFRVEAERFEGWRPWYDYALSAYDALRGDLEPALARIEACLRGLPAVGHAAWQDAVALQLELLARLGFVPRAMQVVAAATERLQDRGMTLAELRDGYWFELAVAHIEALAGLSDAARERLDRLLAGGDGQPPSGLALFLIYEHGARAALIRQDKRELDRYCGLAGATLELHHNRALVARLERLFGEVRADSAIAPDALRVHGQTTSDPSSVAEQTVTTLLANCRGKEQRAQRALDLLVRECKAAGGCLFAASARGPLLLSTTHLPPVDQALERNVVEYLDQLLEDDDGETQLEPALEAAEGPVTVLSHHGLALQPFALRTLRNDRIAIGGVVLLASSSSAPLRVRWELLEAVCQNLVRAGDIELGSET